MILLGGKKMGSSVINLATCDVCGRLFREQRRMYYCEHCKKFYHVCKFCKETNARCNLCGIYLKQKSEPVSIR